MIITQRWSLLQNGYLYDVVGTSSHRGFSIFVFITAPLPKSPSPKQEAEEEGGGDSRRSNATQPGRRGGRREERERERGASPPRV